MGQGIQEWKEVCGRQPYHVNFFKGCLTQILLGPLLNSKFEQ